MAAFDYIAYDRDGRTQKGTLEGDHVRQIRAQLRERGLLPLEVRAVSETASGTRGLAKFFQREGARASISGQDLSLLTRQLATLLNAGLPVEEALRGVIAQSEKPRVKRILTAVRSKVMEGHTFATGLSAFPAVFSELYRATVGAGEEAGQLDAVLIRVADYTENQQWMRQKIKQAVIYPVLMTLVSIAIVIFLMVYVVPQIVVVFEDSGQSLPALTAILINISDFLGGYGIYLLMGLVLLGWGWHRLLQKKTWRARVHDQLLRIPLIGRAIRIVNTARFARTFGILSASGVAVLEAMSAGSQVIANLPMQSAVASATTRVREGQSIARALTETQYFPPMMLHLIASGEASGQLEAMLAKAAESQEREVEALIASTLSLFEPMMILVMGAVVLTIVLAILLPIFEVTQMVGM